MTVSLHVHLLPSLLAADTLTGVAVAVIDVLRATTTIAHALAAGASEVVPCREVNEARRVAEQRGETAVLGGERGGVKISGFHLGNSPAEYSPQAVAGKTVVFTTTNGTAALESCRAAKRVLLAAFVNASRIADRLEAEPAIHLLCAGTEGRITREDVLLAGMLTVDLASRLKGLARLNDEARLAADAWLQASNDVLDGFRLAEILADSHGGRHLQQIGLTRDIEDAVRIDSLDVVPELDVSRWRIRPA